VLRLLPRLGSDAIRDKRPKHLANSRDRSEKDGKWTSAPQARRDRRAAGIGMGWDAMGPAAVRGVVSRRPGKKASVDVRCTEPSEERHNNTMGEVGAYVDGR